MDSKLGILQHSLGVDEFGRGVQFRNHYCTGPRGAAFITCSELVAEGLMVDRGQFEIAAGDHVFNVTPAGVAFVGTNSPKPPVVTRGAKRYSDYIAADGNVKFGDWLKLKSAVQGEGHGDLHAESQRERQRA